MVTVMKLKWHVQWLIEGQDHSFLCGEDATSSPFSVREPTTDMTCLAFQITNTPMAVFPTDGSSAWRQWS
jgi:hypothetical protein